MAARDVVYITVMVFTISLGCFILFFAGTTIFNNLAETGPFNQTTAAAEPLHVAKAKVINKLDYLCFSVFIALLLGVMVLAWLIPANSIFAIFFAILDIVAIIVSTLLSNAWSSITQLANFGNSIASWPLMNHILSNYAIYVAIIGMAALIVTFGKPFIFAQSP